MAEPKSKTAPPPAEKSRPRRPWRDNLEAFGVAILMAVLLKPMIIEAYQIEAEYGQSLEAYESQVAIDGRDLTVDYLRVGRVGLYYVSLDRQQAGIWSKTQNSWVPIPAEYLDALDYALRVAREQAPPNLIELPLWTGED